MIQLSYQSAFDPYHAVFRILRIRDFCWSGEAIPFDQLRIVDFYMAFPFFLQNMKLKRNDLWVRSVSKNYEVNRPFAKLPDQTTLIRRMRPYQIAAVQGLVRREYAEQKPWQKQMVRATDRKLPTQLKSRIEDSNSKDQDLMRALNAITDNYELLGDDGLKARSGLLEYRYDAV